MRKLLTDKILLYKQNAFDDLKKFLWSIIIFFSHN